MSRLSKSPSGKFSCSKKYSHHQVKRDESHRPSLSLSPSPSEDPGSGPPVKPAVAQRLTKAEVRRCRDAASTSPAMETLWLRESEAAALLDAIGLPLNPHCSIDLRERSSPPKIKLPLSGSGSHSKDERQRRPRDFQTMSSHQGSTTTTDSIAGAENERTSGTGGETAPEIDECFVHVASVLSEVATRSSLLPHELLPLNATYGRQALTYLKRLVRGPRGGLRVQQLLLTCCDTKVMDWKDDQVRPTRDIIKEKGKREGSTGSEKLKKKPTYSRISSPLIPLFARKSSYQLLRAHQHHVHPHDVFVLSSTLKFICYVSPNQRTAI